MGHSAERPASAASEKGGPKRIQRRPAGPHAARECENALAGRKARAKSCKVHSKQGLHTAEEFSNLSKTHWKHPKHGCEGLMPVKLPRLLGLIIQAVRFGRL